MRFDIAPDKQKNLIIQLYAAFAAAIFLHFVPHSILGTMGLFLIVAVMIAAYFLRSKSEEHDLMDNHTTYIIRTIWIGSLYLSIGVIAATILISPRIDQSAIQGAVDAYLAGDASAIQDPKILMQLLEDNFNLFIYMGVPLVTPGILFLIYRCVYGVTRAAKGYRLAKPQSWL